MALSLSGINPLNWLFATFLQVTLIIGSLVTRKIASVDDSFWQEYCSLQVRQREISEDIYRAGKLVVLQVTDKKECCHVNFRDSFFQ
jgi:hypothetical protein